MKEQHVREPKIVVCKCGLAVKTACEEYFCPKCGRHIVPPPGKCSLCSEKQRQD